MLKGYKSGGDLNFKDDFENDYKSSSKYLVIKDIVKNTTKNSKIGLETRFEMKQDLFSLSILLLTVKKA